MLYKSTPSPEDGAPSENNPRDAPFMKVIANLPFQSSIAAARHCSIVVNHEFHYQGTDQQQDEHPRSKQQ